MSVLLTRDEFRESVFKRDDFKCVICGNEGKDAHHILERRLWDDGGYYVSNGATLCTEHHILAEKTLLSCDEIRDACGIKVPLLPSYFDRDKKYDKWGNEILTSGMRVKGELFFDESVQKILSDVMDQFSTYVKFPKIRHLPFSPGINRDDRVLSEIDLNHYFKDKQIVITEKLDGENTSLYNDNIHARSIDGKNHWSRDWVKNLHASIKFDIPKGWRICGENLYAKHSIKYIDLPSYFVVFTIYDENNQCLSWKETKEYCELLGLRFVPVLYEGNFNDVNWDSLFRGEGGSVFGGDQEGYVLRISDSFSFTNHSNSIVKFVRKNHVTTNHNWMYTATEKNELR
jgi:hypothetical protein